MDKKDFEKKFWFFYIDIEEEFLEISKTIPIDSINSKTFSYKYSRLLRTICSEIDTTLKRFMEFYNYPYAHGNIIEYESFIEDKLDDFKSSTVTLYKSAHNYETLKPFANWTSGKAPEWWTLNNKLKHGRDEVDDEGIEKFKYANQETILNALAGLFIILMYFYEEILKNNFPDSELRVPLPQSEVFHLENWGDYYTKIIANKFFFEIKDDGHLYLTGPSN